MATPQLQSFTLAGHPVTVASNLSPPGASSVKSSLDDEAEPAAAPMPNSSSRTASAGETPPLEVPCDRSVSSLYCVYTVQPGDTLSRIAKLFGLEGRGDVASWELLVQSNKPDIVSADDYIQAGQKLRVPLENGAIHVVLTGETLSELARDYGVEASNIAGDGGVTPSVLTIGQELLVREPSRIPPPRTASAAAAPTVTQTPEATTTPEVTTTATPDSTPAATPTPTAVAATGTASPAATGTVRSATTTPGSTLVRGTPSPSRAGFIWPATGPISSYFGPSHPLGIDIDLYANPNAPIVAAAAGTVTFAGGNTCCSYGLYVIVDHGNGFSTLYAHLASISVSQGQRVLQGQLLGLGGRTGYATGNHLHFEVRLGDAVIDPLSVLP